MCYWRNVTEPGDMSFIPRAALIPSTKTVFFCSLSICINRKGNRKAVNEKRQAGELE